MVFQALAETDQPQSGAAVCGPGDEGLVHDLCLRLADWRTWELACRAMLEAGGEIDAARLTRSASGYTARLRLAGLTEAGACSLVERLGARRVAKCLSIEHVRVSAAA